MARSICFISLPAYGYFNGGPAFGSRPFYYLSRYLSDEFDVGFIVGDYGQPKQEHREGVTLYRSYTPNPAANRTERIEQAVRFADAVARADASVYVVEGRPAKLLFLAPIISAQGGEVVYQIASDEHVEARCGGLGDASLSAVRLLLQRLAGVVTQTEYQRDTMQTFHGVDSTMIPNGYPPADTIPPHEGREYFLWVGRLEERLKRPHLYLDLAEQVPEAGFHIAGPKEGEQYGAAVIDRAADLDNVTYLGSVTPNEIHQHYQQAIALVNTSVLEGFPSTFLEAWRYATPVLSLSVDPNRFLIDELPFGGPAGNLTTLENTVRRLADSTKLRRRLGNAGLESFRARYRIDRVGSSYARLFSRL